MQIAAVTILYNPDDSIVRNIHSYIDEIKELYIMDNSPQINEKVQNLQDGKKIFYFHDGVNGGIAQRLNEAAKLAAGKGYEWLLAMDQDSYFDPGSAGRFIALSEEYPDRQLVAVFGLNYSEPGLKELPVYREVPLLITSGSLINLSLIEEIGFFDEKLFIDEVDSEYCYRAYERAYKIVECSRLLLHHQLGEMKEGRSLSSGKKTPRRLHSPQRMYYLVRNYFYVRRIHPDLSEDKKKEMTHGLFIHIKNNLLYNDHRFQVFINIIRGFLDFRKGYMGRKF